MKINLKDITHIIPVRIDSEDRFTNLSIVLKYLRKYCDTNIYIIEHNDEHKITKEFLEQYQCEYTFLKSHDPLFYKTMCINDAFKYTSTPYISIYDTDVLLKPEQLQQTCDELHKGTPVVYPYDGTFLDVPKFIVNNIKKSLDTEGTVNELEGINESYCEKGLGRVEITPDRQSFGGCVFFDRKAFHQGGMANKNLISYGPEDIEIYVRFKKLGYDIKRIPGPIYHLRHQRGINSTENHHRVQKNEEEFQKILNMDPIVLKMFVESFPWVREITE